MEIDEVEVGMHLFGEEVILKDSASLRDFSRFQEWYCREHS
jgi:hypothetical protein